MGKTVLVIAGRQCGKTILMQKELVSYLKKNPKATILTTRDNETIIEKYIGSSKDEP